MTRLLQCILKILAIATETPARMSGRTSISPHPNDAVAVDDAALFDELHDCDGRDRLRDAGDAKQAGRLHLLLARHVGITKALLQQRRAIFHDDHDRTKYRGPECVGCNTATSGR
mgnify:CR=1 FL=1